MVWSKVSEGEGAHRQTYDKTSNGPHTFFYVPGLRCMEKLYGKIKSHKIPKIGPAVVAKNSSIVHASPTLLIFSLWESGTGTT